MSQNPLRKKRVVTVMPCVPVPGQCKRYVVYVIEASWAQGNLLYVYPLIGVRTDEATGESGGNGLIDDDLIIVARLKGRTQ
jgi:hypothetical protein